MVKRRTPPIPDESMAPPSLKYYSKEASMNMRRKVLILSTDETFRGPLAVAVLRHMAGNRYEIAMPGNPSLHPLLAKTLEEVGIAVADPGHIRPDSFLSAPIDFVITISSEAYCPIIIRAQTIHWRVQRPEGGDGS